MLLLYRLVDIIEHCSYINKSIIFNQCDKLIKYKPGTCAYNGL